MIFRPRLFLTRRWPALVESELRLRYEVTVDPEDRKLDVDALREAMQSFDVLCPTVSDTIDESVLAVPKASVALIANYGAGTDHIDLAAARAAGIPVSNTPAVLTEATAELAILLMLMVSRRAGEGERELRRGAWTGWRPTHLCGQSLAGRTLGLVGFGHIGQATAKLAASAFGMKICYHSRRRAAPAVERAHNATYFDVLGDLAAHADVLSLHCFGGSETFHLVDQTLINQMKSGAILVNTARGSVVNERDLAAALDSGRLAGAGLDVYEREPAVTEELLRQENVVLLPHLGSATRETRVAMGMRVVANIDRFFAGEDLLDRAD